MDDLATLEEKTTIRSFMDGLTVYIMKNGRRFRGLDPVGKDHVLLLALSDPAYMISELTNKMLRKWLSNTHFASGNLQRDAADKRPKRVIGGIH